MFIMQIKALRRMFEDSVEKLCMDHIRKPLDILLPKLIALFTCPEEMVKNIKLFKLF
jgi:hypothetical protein